MCFLSISVFRNNCISFKSGEIKHHLTKTIMFLRLALLGILLLSILGTETAQAGSSFLSPAYKNIQVKIQNNAFLKLSSSIISWSQILYSVQRFGRMFLEEEGGIPENDCNKPFTWENITTNLRNKPTNWTKKTHKEMQRSCLNKLLTTLWKWIGRWLFHKEP